MSEAKLKTAILGLNLRGRELLEAARSSGYYDIVAVGGRDAEALEVVRRQNENEGLEHYRQLVVQSEIDVLLVAGSMHFCGEHVRAAMKDKCDIVRVGPPALDFEQAGELTVTASKEKVRFITAGVWNFAGSFSKFRDFIRAEGRENFHMVNVVCNVPQDLDNPRDRWLTDPQMAGGGVLMHNCYELIDQITASFDVPQQVYSLNTNHAPDKQQRLSLTEDTAVVTMRFSDTLIGNVMATRSFGPPTEELTVHGDDKYVTVSPVSFEVCDNDGNVIERSDHEYDHAKLLEELLVNVAENRLDGKKCSLFTNPLQALNTMSVIEAAYLSARTASPEEPAKILNMSGIEPGKL